MQVIGASNGLPTGTWAVSLRSISHWRGRSVEITPASVANIGYVDASKRYNYATGGVGVISGGMFFGPVGAAIGGLLPAAFKDSVVHFAIQLRDGTVLQAKGSREEYEKLVKWSMQDPASSLANTLLDKMVNSAVRTQEREAARAEARGLATDEDRERLRGAIAADKAATARRRLTKEEKAERAARRKTVYAKKLGFKATARLIQEIDEDYRGTTPQPRCARAPEDAGTNDAGARDV